MPATELAAERCSSRWTFHPARACRRPQPPAPYADSAAIRAWLRQLGRDPGTMAQFRLLLRDCRAGVQLWRDSDEEVVRLLASLLHAGQIHAHRVPTANTFGRSAETTDGTGSAAPAPPPKSAASSSQAATQSQATEQDTDTFSNQTDGAATAAVLRDAAASGVPFCEECAKAAAARRAA